MIYDSQQLVFSPQGRAIVCRQGERMRQSGSGGKGTPDQERQVWIANAELLMQIIPPPSQWTVLGRQRFDWLGLDGA